MTSNDMSTSRGSSKTNDIVVFEIVRDSICAECGEELERGRWLRRENERALCLTCADLAHLVYLPSGNAALTRRASRYSSLRAVIVRFSRARGRYERQGVLVEEDALARAEQECLADADAREQARERRAEREQELDRRYQTDFARCIRDLYPGCPEAECLAIAEHACHKYSGRVGRSADAKRFDAEAIGLAVRAHVRHVHTKYDILLMSGLERGEARSEVHAEIEHILTGWSATGAPLRVPNENGE
jgi:hypothetical protein